MVKHDDAPMRVKNSGGISRRTVTRGMAWSVPAVAVATAAPAFANHSIPIITRQCGDACKHPGNPKWYHFTFCFTNTSTVPIKITLDRMVINGITGPNIIPSAQFTVNAGSTVCKYVDAGLFGNSANGQGYLYFDYEYTTPGGEFVSGEESFSTLVNDLPVCGSPKAPNDPAEDPNSTTGHTTAPSQSDCPAPTV